MSAGIDIRGNVPNLIKFYFDNRRQQVYIESIFDNKKQIYASTVGRIVQGVPQGSILGPTLFLIYMFGLPNCMNKAPIFQFPDDTSCIVSSDDFKILSVLVIENNKTFVDYCADNRVTTNNSKTAVKTEE